jgi:hypothetical protein
MNVTRWSGRKFINHMVTHAMTAIALGYENLTTECRAR